MFTGIIEQIGTVKNILQEKTNVHLSIQSALTQELKIDQSVAHNGVCLTVVSIQDDVYSVTAIKETLDRTNLGMLMIGDSVNLERCTRVGDRLDGHIVQGHVDTTGECIRIEDLKGSWKFSFRYDSPDITVEKGSIAVNGVSLTVVDSWNKEFSVCIIPYTYEHTNFKDIQVGSRVNLEFDIIGKYVSKLLALRGF
jgi:riboflavin synthase